MEERHRGGIQRAGRVSGAGPEARVHGRVPLSTGSAGLDETMKPDFFKGFPPTAVFERNLVWDTGMLEMFGQEQFEHLKLNAPYG